MDNSAIISYLKSHPGAIAEEIGASSVEMNRAFKAGLVIKLGSRKTNRRGRPPVEYALAGAEGVTQDERVSETVAHAKQRVDDHRAYERSASALSRTRIEHGLGSAEHVEAKLQHQERFPLLPVIPAPADYSLAGIITTGAEE